MIRQVMLQEKSVSGLSSEKIITLFTAGLLKKESPFPDMLEKEGSFEILNASNNSVQSDKTRYTTILKAKGLERDVVILVCPQVADKRNIFQLFIGASRAKCRVYLVLKKE